MKTEIFFEKHHDFIMRNSRKSIIFSLLFIGFYGLVKAGDYLIRKVKKKIPFKIVTKEYIHQLEYQVKLSSDSQFKAIQESNKIKTELILANEGYRNSLVKLIRSERMLCDSLVEIETIKARLERIQRHNLNKYC